MTTFLFWNLHGKPLAGAVAALVQNHGVDVVLLAECRIAPGLMLSELNASVASFHFVPSPGCDRIQVFTRFGGQFLPAVLDLDRMTIRHLKLPGAMDILVAAVHLPSKLHWSDGSQAAESSRLAQYIEQAERTVGHRRTILVGDLNMNPFDDGVVNANGLHGVMSRGVAEKLSRKVQGQDYPFFYNPMWSLMGDASPGPSGTYFATRSEHRSFFWHSFDQLLIRPDLLPRFANRDLQVLDSDGVRSLLLRDGRPDRYRFSDHLPLLFRLNL